MQHSKSIIFITGMHRSGTSAIAGLLHNAGISGGNDILQPAYDNPKGFYENTNVLNINRSILSVFNMEWDNLIDLPVNWSQSINLDSYKTSISDFLSAEFENNNYLYIKDPRLCHLAPIWHEAGTKHKYNIYYLIVLRNPVQIANSLKTRNNFTHSKSFSLWCDHLLNIELLSRNRNRLFVEYNDVIKNPIYQTNRILDFVNFNSITNHHIENVKNFISPELNHETQDDAHNNIDFPYIKDLWELLTKLKSEPNATSSYQYLDKLRVSFKSTMRLFNNNQYNYIASLNSNDPLFKPITNNVHLGNNILQFKLKKDLNISKYYIYLSKTYTHLNINNITIYLNDNSIKTIQPVFDSPIVEHGNEFIIDKNARIEIENNTISPITSIQIDVNYIDFDKDAIKAISMLIAKSKEWLKHHITQNVKDGAIDQIKSTIDEIKSEGSNVIKRVTSANKSIANRLRSNSYINIKLKEHANNLNILLKYNRIELDKLNNSLFKIYKENKSLQSSIDKYKSDIENDKALLKDTEYKLHNYQEKYINEYRQKNNALNELNKYKSSVSYIIGKTITWPFRMLYNIYSKKPFDRTNLYLFLSIVYLSLRRPIQFIKYLNPKNINTLILAIRSESNDNILNNYSNLLNNNTHVSINSKYNSQLDNYANEAEAEKNYSNNTEHIELTVYKSKSGKHELITDKPVKSVVLWASPNLPDFDSSSGGRRATRIIEILTEKYEIYLFTSGNKEERHKDMLEEIGVNIIETDDPKEVKNKINSVDIIVFSFFYTYFDCGHFLKYFPKAIVVIDTVDVHWVRHERSKGLWKDLSIDEITKKKKLEISVYKKADIIWAVTNEDRIAIQKVVPNSNIYIVSNIHQTVIDQYRDPGNNNLLFFGGFNHYPNIIAVQHLVRDIFPKICNKIENVKLVIAGSNAPSEIVSMGDLPNIIYKGFIEESNLLELYRNTFLVISPLQAGAGIKGKICESIVHMVPVVTNSIGNEGIGLINKVSGFISDDEEELVELTINALNRKYDLHSITCKAQEKLSSIVSPEVVKNNMFSSLKGKQISICIVTWNRIEYLQRCIESIEMNTNYPHYKILVYSNGCTDGTQSYLKAAAKLNPSIIPILSDSNDVFVIPNNIMMELYSENDIMLLNNDTIVTKNWLSSIRDAAYSSKDIGIAGSKILYPDGKLQEFGSELYSDGTGRNIGKGDDPKNDKYSTLSYAGYVSGCAFYIKRDTIEMLGVFDERFSPCYCEDSDYCYTAWKNNIATVVTPESVIYHHEGGTSGTDINMGYKKYQTTNMKLFLDKHKSYLNEINTKVHKLNKTSELHTN